MSHISARPTSGSALQPATNTSAPVGSRVSSRPCSPSSRTSARRTLRIVQQALTHRIPLSGARGTAGVIVDDPDTFHNLVSANYTGEWIDPSPDTRGGEEPGYVRSIDRETFAYAEAIQTASESGQNTVAHPTTSLGRQLEIVARLLGGGLQAPFFLTSEFVCDTRAGQRATHDGRMASVGQSLAAFLTDLDNQGLGDRDLVVTSAEFARRVEENGSQGTDHGTAAPHLALGAQVLGGIYGSPPSLTDLDQSGNLLVQQDFRAMVATILRDFFGANPNSVANVLMGDFPSLGFLEVSSGVEDPHPPARDLQLAAHPNPIVRSPGGAAQIRFRLAREGDTRLELFDAAGRRTAELRRTHLQAGAHKVAWRPPRDLATGAYLVRRTTPQGTDHLKLILAQ
ncbi:MAG: DUF1501 domain-containing protein [Candidatus Eisenbacteria bacterium]|nr:DUF1501 domain-containing protein [Candidatus Eisenbacteria bacterium]